MVKNTLSHENAATYGGQFHQVSRIAVESTHMTPKVMSVTQPLHAPIIAPPIALVAVLQAGGQRNAGRPVAAGRAAKTVPLTRFQIKVLVAAGFIAFFR